MKDTMTEKERTNLCASLLNHTLGMNDLPNEIHGRIATALVLIDPQEGENLDAAIEEANAYLCQDNSEAISQG